MSEGGREQEGGREGEGVREGREKGRQRDRERGGGRKEETETETETCLRMTSMNSFPNPYTPNPRLNLPAHDFDEFLS